ncbi:MAG TPA: MEDS domain-containing protein [Adhaeribacter sp.]|nr:MEDS domain-containing protein [Adhaeribacter sp.]
MDSSKNWQRCSTTTFWEKEASCSHVVQIYENDEEFLNLLEGFVSGGIAAGDAVIILATKAHQAGLEKKLRAAGTDVAALKAKDQFLALDAEAVLEKIMVNDWPDYRLFMQTISEVFGRARKGGRPVRAFGELVAILWGRGNSAATIMLEQLWNMYCEKETFTLFCAYPKSDFPDNSEVSLRNICKTHAKRIAGSGNSAREVSFLDLA